MLQELDKAIAKNWCPWLVNIEGKDIAVVPWLRSQVAERNHKIQDLQVKTIKLIEASYSLQMKIRRATTRLKRKTPGRCKEALTILQE